MGYSPVSSTSAHSTRPMMLTPPPGRAAPTTFYSTGPPHAPAANAVTRARSHFDLRSGYASRNTPIYQTSGRSTSSAYPASARSVPPSPLSDIPMSAYASFGPYYDVPSERAYLPSFLSEMITSPALSTSSSAELSSLEDLSLSSPATNHKDLPPSPNSVGVAGGGSSIWGFDGEERRAWHQLRTRQSREGLVVRQ
jgi:hypothetical protein